MIENVYRGGHRGWREGLGLHGQDEVAQGYQLAGLDGIFELRFGASLRLDGPDASSTTSSPSRYRWLHFVSF